MYRWFVRLEFPVATDLNSNNDEENIEKNQKKLHINEDDGFE